MTLAQRRLDAETKRLVAALREEGLSDEAIEAAWPDWWSDEAAQSPSAKAMLRFSLARLLGLKATSLVGDRVKFVWEENGRFKNITAAGSRKRSALISFCVAVGRLVCRTVPLGELSERISLEGLSADSLRSSILGSGGLVDLQGLVATSWALGIPVVHLKVFPLARKGMDAVVVRDSGRYVIFLCKDSLYPAPVAFSIAHELGHITCGHVNEYAEKSSIFVDVESDLQGVGANAEEEAANHFAVELLTGKTSLNFLLNTNNFSPKNLSTALLSVTERDFIEPGTLALCLAHQTKDWARSMAALKYLYPNPTPVWRIINSTALGQMDLTSLTDEELEYTMSVMGMSDE